MVQRNSPNQTIERFLEGATHRNIILMCMVFMLATAYASLSKSIGGIDATVLFGLQFIPSGLVLPALFTISFLGKVSPSALTATSYYCWILDTVAVIGIVLQYPV